MTFEEYVARSSRWVLDVIGYARTQEVRMGEDALTSMVVLGVRALGVTGARVYDVRAGEHEHGADVALWLEVSANNWAGFAIQIKKANLRDGTGFYEKLGVTGHRTVAPKGHPVSRTRSAVGCVTSRYSGGRRGEAVGARAGVRGGARG